MTTTEHLASDAERVVAADRYIAINVERLRTTTVVTEIQQLGQILTLDERLRLEWAGERVGWTKVDALPVPELLQVLDGTHFDQMIGLL